MSEQLFSLHSWPRAIVHLDGDAFFTSCEEAIHPDLKGKELITGGERGIVACASYPAKKMGIKRGVPLHEARKIVQEASDKHFNNAIVECKLLSFKFTVIGEVRAPGTYINFNNYLSKNSITQKPNINIIQLKYNFKSK